MNFLDIFLIIAVVLFELSFVSISIAAISMAPWLPTKKKDVLRALELAELKSGQKIYDLGCGTGTIIFQAAQRYPVKAIGIERAFPLYIICKIKALFFKGIGSVEFRRENLFKGNYSDADVIYVFGLPGPLAFKVKPKLERELKNDTKIISYVFSVDGWEPKKTDWPKKGNPIYLYEIKK